MEQITLLIENYINGERNVNKLARIVGRSKSSVIPKLFRLQNKPQKGSADLKVLNVFGLKELPKE